LGLGCKELPVSSSRQGRDQLAEGLTHLGDWSLLTNHARLLLASKASPGCVCGRWPSVCACPSGGSRSSSETCAKPVCHLPREGGASSTASSVRSRCAPTSCGTGPWASCCRLLLEAERERPEQGDSRITRMSLVHPGGDCQRDGESMSGNGSDARPGGSHTSAWRPWIPRSQIRAQSRDPASAEPEATRAGLSWRGAVASSGDAAQRWLERAGPRGRADVEDASRAPRRPSSTGPGSRSSTPRSAEGPSSLSAALPSGRRARRSLVVAPALDGRLYSPRFAAGANGSS